MHIFRLMVISAVVLMGSSCVFDNYELPDTEDISMGVKLRIPTKATSSDGYQVGTDGENYIDIRNGKFRMYFFGEDNVLIDRFVPTQMSSVASSNFINYDIAGKVPASVVGLDVFKMVVIANWPDFSLVDSQMINGQTRLSDLWTATWTQFQYIENIELNFQNVMPFYGVREYRNVGFEVGVLKILEPVDLLRSLAKVEVIFNRDATAPVELRLTDVKLDRYNKSGFCAPLDVDHQDDYVHGDWELDYAPLVNIVPGGEVGTAFQFRHIDLEDKSKDVWMGYVPEYRNVGVEDFASLQLKFAHQPGNEDPFIIHFSEYVEGVTDNTKRYDIERNNLYRFTVNADLFVTSEFAVFVDDFDPTPDQEIVM